MLTVCCVKHGKKYGPEYVRILHDMVRRNLPSDFEGRFLCFTDDPEGLDGIETRFVPGNVQGWWQKLFLFSPGVIPDGERVLYFDLDTVITGSLDKIAAYDGAFAILRDFYRQDGMQSSVMAWEAGNFTTAFWTDWVEKGMPQPAGGDQEWIEGGFTAKPDFWQDLFPDQFVSYKADNCWRMFPKGAKVVVFHGEPRPHQVKGWVEKVWKVGGGSSLEMELYCNTPTQELLDNCRLNLKREIPLVQPVEAHDSVACIVGGGPSLAHELPYLRMFKDAGAKVFATNGTLKWLQANDLKADAEIIMDARLGNRRFVANRPDVQYYLSTQCHPDLLDFLTDQDVTLFHMASPAMLPLLDEVQRTTTAIGGGRTVGLNAIVLAYVLGYRDIRVFGLDSSYGDSHHAYEQPANDDDEVIDVEYCGRTFRTTPWMVNQVEEFKETAKALILSGVTLTIRGDGLLPWAAENMQPVSLAYEQRAAAILNRLTGENPVGVEIGIFKGALSATLLSHRSDLYLYMVDAWRAHEYVADEHERKARYGEYHSAMTQADHDDCKRIASDLTEFASDRRQLIQSDSVTAASRVPDGSLDFVFVDADHSYIGCKRDIEAWLPKLKPNGLMCGHDYANTEHPDFEVTQAVDEFVSAHGLTLDLGDNFTWFTRVPRLAVAA